MKVQVSGTENGGYKVKKEARAGNRKNGSEAGTLTV